LAVLEEHPLGKISNEVVLITGGGRGIGRAIAEACAQTGYKVAIAARSRKELDETADGIQARGQSCRGFLCDVNEPDSVVNLVRSVENELGTVYGLVCAAGIYGEIGPFWKTPIDAWESAVDVNLKGTARAIHAALPGMIREKRGRVILFSGGGQGPLPSFSPYATSKGAIWRLTETLGAELAPFNIFTNAIAPGAVNTRFLEDLIAAGPDKVGQAAYQKAKDQQQKGGEPPEKAAALCLYLLSERSYGLYGKILSAIWDDYENFASRFGDLSQMSRTDIFSVRRVVESKETK
jgi:NAD(P)-dependent dehydrogenase (short-subunit alcohol dehydrogenase family)